MRIPSILLLSGMLAIFSPVPGYAQQLTPAQMAYVKAETRKADHTFAVDVAKIVGVKPSDVTRAMPAKGRITDPAARVIAALEHQLGKPLDEAQKAAIIAADKQRRDHIMKVNADAAKATR